MKKEEMLNIAKLEQCYIMYQKFIDNYKLPKIRYEFHDPIKEKLRYWARFNSKDLFSNLYIMNINDALLKKDNKFISAIMFHEFTHLYDSINFLCYPQDTFRTVMYLYSEYHAAKVQLMKLLEYKSICDTNFIAPETIILTDQGNIQLIEYIENKSTNKLRNITKEYLSGDLKAEAWTEIKSLLNIWGFIDLYNSCAVNRFAIDFSLLPLELQEDFSNLYVKLQNFNNTHNAVNDILIIEKCIREKFKVTNRAAREINSIKKS